MTGDLNIDQHSLIQMESKDMGRIVISKPVASRPPSSVIGPFPDLSAGIIRGSSPNVGLELTSGPIKPKTVRLAPKVNLAPDPAVPSQAREMKTMLPPEQEKCEPSDQQERSSLSSNFEEHSRDLTKTAGGDFSGYPVEESIDLPSTSPGDRMCYDGYNWRKYGQKQVKGSEYPRGYYKCTQPNCPVKKTVESSVDGKIAEIVYKGEHNHPKPQPSKRGPVNGQDRGCPFISGRTIERKRCSEGKVANDTNTKASLSNDCIVERGVTDAGLNLDPPSAKQEDGTMRLGMDPDEPSSKRRKTKNPLNGLEINSEIPPKPPVSVQGSVDPEILSDGFRWRKYGQKVVKGNPYPRNYYKCTGLECSVRKHLDRALHDPAVLITTYEGKHNHEMPLLRSMDPPSSYSTPRARASKRTTPVGGLHQEDTLSFKLWSDQ
ncbi:hypothetical protein SAY87_027882 [Trapa incisa]|uniref:WRKY domain-containing protein n=1 Tax=Trapa incisa TaxID=236973 RepID=A0AAN7QR39_9MYRT|nr:hypothetical protein SAY87_027882 [Trapa incisa]